MNLATETSSRRATFVALGLLIIAAIAIGLLPSLSKLAYQDGSNPATVVVIRNVTAVLLLGGYMLARQGIFRLPMAVLAVAILATVASATMNYSFLSAVFHTDINLAILILFTHPFLIAFYYHAIGVSRLTTFRMIWAVLAFVGLGLALAVSFENASKLGLLLSAVAALACTVMVIAMLKVNERVGSVTTNFHMVFWSLLGFTVALFITQDIQLPRSALGWLSSAGNGAAYVTALLAFLAAARLIGPSRASLLTFMEPLAAILLAAILFDERLSLIQWVGVALVALGLFFMEANFSRRKTKTAPA
jgi:drug/metabolite transporter (DMT)-like permease